MTRKGNGSITFLKDRNRNPWRAQIRNRQYYGNKPKVGYFSSEADAKEWLTDRAREAIRAVKDLEPTKEHLSKKTVGQLIETYRTKYTSKKQSADTENGVFDNFLAFNGFQDRTLLAFKRQDAWDYVEYLETEYRWKGKSVKPATVKRHVQIMKRVWKVAELKWRGYEDLKNPWTNVEQSEVIKHRTRRLRPGELARLSKATYDCRKDYIEWVRLALYLAIETGMRLQEILNLRWEDIYLERRRIHIRESKMDYKRTVNGRWIVLTIMALYTLGDLAEDLLCGFPEDEEDPFPDGKLRGKLFPMSKKQFKEIWLGLIMKTGIPLQFRQYRIPGTKTIIEPDGEGLHFHDLRREAGSRFKRCLVQDEIAAMLGHGDETVTDIYIEHNEDDLTVIQDKLDRSVLEGLTHKEVLERGCEILIKETQDGDLKPVIVSTEWLEGLYEDKSKANEETTNVVPIRKKARE